MARVAKSHSGVGVCSLVMGSLRAMPVMPAMPAIQRFLTCLPRQSLLARARPKRRSRQSGLPVAMGSPRQVRDFAKATGHLAKTDTLDEAVLARFADAIHPEPRPLPDAASQVLAALAERRHQLVGMLTAEKKRFQPARPPVRAKSTAHIQWLEQALSELDQTLHASPLWGEREQLLRSVPFRGSATLLPSRLSPTCRSWARG